MAQDFKKQLDAIIELETFTEKFRTELYNLQQSYITRVRNLLDSGVPRQIAERYEYKFWEQNNHKLETLIRNIEEINQPYIVKQKAAIENLLQN